MDFDIEKESSIDVMVAPNNKKIYKGNKDFLILFI